MDLTIKTFELATVENLIETVNKSLTEDCVNEMFDTIADCIEDFRDPNNRDEALLPEYVAPGAFANVRDMFVALIVDRALKEMAVGSLMGLILSLRQGRFIPEVAVGFKQLQMVISSKYLEFLDVIGAFFPIAEIVGSFFRDIFQSREAQDLLTWVTVIYGREVIKIPDLDLGKYVASTINSNMLILFMRH